MIGVRPSEATLSALSMQSSGHGVIRELNTFLGVSGGPSHASVTPCHLAFIHSSYPSVSPPTAKLLAHPCPPVSSLSLFERRASSTTIEPRLRPLIVCCLWLWTCTLQSQNPAIHLANSVFMLIPFLNYNTNTVVKIRVLMGLNPKQS